MRLRTALTVAFLGLAAWSGLRAQKPFKKWPGIEYDDWPLPPDYQDKHEWTRARLRYPDIYGYPERVMTLRDGRLFPGYWTMDFPRSDRHLLEGVRRLTRIDTKSVEQVVTLDGSDDVFNWPMPDTVLICASCEVICELSVGLVGSWFCSWVTSSVRKVF